MRSKKLVDSGKRDDNWIPKSAAAGFRQMSSDGCNATRDFCLMIEDIEPIPMKNRIPVHKQPNAAEKFWNSQQHVSDERGQAPNRCGYVDSHNDACPKLKDELNDKRDLSKPMACQTTRLSHAPGVRCATQTLVSGREWLDPNCIMCSGRRRRSGRTLKRSPRYERKSRNSRVSKSRRAPLRRKIKINRARSTNNERWKVETNAGPKNPKSGVDLESTHYPNSSRGSLSSYNSYLSMGHEPMGSG